MRRVISFAALIVAILAGSIAATQYLASTFSHAPELGPRLSLGGVHLYPPFAWRKWQLQWGRHARKPFGIALGMSFGGGFLGLGVALRLRGSETPKVTGAFGTARWANRKELAKAGMLGERGIVLCQTADAVLTKTPSRSWKLEKPGDLIRYDGETHAILFAPTGSGKGIGVVLPTLLSWTSSVLVYDPKGENWNATAGWRRQFSHCLRFEPTSRHSVRFNPLLHVRPYPFDVRDAQNINEILVNPDNMTNEQRSYWKDAGQAFLTALILHVLYAEPIKSITGVMHAMSDPERPIEDLLEAMLTTRHLPDGPHPTVARGARAMLNKADKDRSGVVSTALSFLGIYEDPLVAENTATSDFMLDDLVCGDRPVSLYLCVPASDSDRLKPVIRLLLNFLARRLTEHEWHVDGPGGLRPKRHQLLCLIDEFPLQSVELRACRALM